MVKLTQQQVAFIDCYLQNSGIDYFDVRLEMTDHVATEIEQAEGSFYKNFNSYMAQHKEELLASYKKQKKEMMRMAAKQFFRTAVKPIWLVLFVLLALGVAGMVGLAGVATALTILEYTFVGITATVTLHLLYSRMFRKRKYFMTWTSLFYNYAALAWILWIFRYDNILNAITPYAALLYYTLLWYLIIVFSVTLFLKRKEVMQRYKTA